MSLTIQPAPDQSATQGAADTTAGEAPADTAGGSASVRPNRWPSPLVIAALASIGAGGVHAAAVGAHGEHRFLATMFVWVAAFQVCWGIAMLLRPRVELTTLGLAGNAFLVGVWLVTRLRGLSFVEGLEVRESVQFADAAAAGLGLVVVGITLGTLLTPGAADDHRLTNMSIPAFLVAALALPAMVTAGTHAHSGADPGHDHGASEAHVVTQVDHPTDATTGPEAASATVASAVAPVPYRAVAPVDLSGVDGVTPEQQARAEDLVERTLERLPQFADVDVARARGWRSIGDGITGFEHYLNTALLDDGRELDPDYPESLVYRIGLDGSRQLVSAMFIAAPGTTLDTVPDIGGRLTQWHVHDNLCFTNDPVAPRIAGLRPSGGTCPEPLVAGPEWPMIHVWIVPHRCGPFAALEGLAAGQVADGETRWCDHVHGTAG
jgi:hypothetical protein